MITPSQLKISLDSHTPAAVATARTLRRLVEQHNLMSFIFTNQVNLISSGRSTSHPVLTLVARSDHNSDLLLAEFLHEQFHWFVASRSERLRLAISRFEQLEPSFTTFKPPLGANTPTLTYIHFAVCYLEQAAIRKILGEDAAQTVRSHARQYLAVYDLITSRPEVVRQVILDCNLMHPSLEDSAEQGGQPAPPMTRVFKV